LIEAGVPVTKLGFVMGAQRGQVWRVLEFLLRLLNVFGGALPKLVPPCDLLFVGEPACVECRLLFLLALKRRGDTALLDGVGQFVRD
jgi:hypothetical protein